MTAENSLEKLTSTMVHDVRTPLTIFEMLAYSLEKKYPNDPETQEELKILKEESAKINKIVSEYRETIRPYFKEG